MDAPSAGAVSHLVLVAVPVGLLAGVRDALQDWSALGLVSPFCWAEDPPGDGGARAVAQQIEGGCGVNTTVEQLLAEGDYRRIRLCVLVPAFSGAPVLAPDVEDHLLRLVQGSRGAAEVDHVRVSVTRPGCGPGPGAVAREGWHNLVLSPEDSRGPGLGHQRLEGTDDPLEVGSHTAAGLCGVLGLWSGLDEAPMDSVNLLPAQHARVARTFYRSLDACDVEQSLRASVLSMSGELPRCRVGNGRAVRVEDVALATSTMADQLWSRHAGVLIGPRSQQTPTTAKPISVGRAIRMLFSFLKAAIRNAPMAWYQALTNKIASGVAAQVQRSVLGRAPSAYEVVVRGVRADGSRASWSDLAAASAQLGEVVSEPVGRSQHLAHASLETLWRDYVSATLTLADAGDRAAHLPPVTVGVDRGVLPGPADCAPGADAAFAAIPPALQDVAGRIDIEVADVLGVRSVREALVAARSDPMTGLAAEGTITALDRWTAQHEHSFAVQSGRRLGSAVLALHGEVRALLAALADVGQEQAADDDLRRRQQRLATWMKVFAVVAVLALVVLGVLGGLAVLAWSRVAIAAGVVVVAWFVGSFVLFLKSQRNLFAELHRREVAASAAEVNRDNLRYALQDLRRTTSAYGQHLAWSRVLSSVLAQPFGAVDPPPPDDVLSREGLPLSMGLGRAAPEPAVLSDVSAQVRRDSYRAGWLTTPWEHILADAPTRLGSDGIDLCDDPVRMYALTAGPDSLLDRWADLVRSGGPGQSSGQAFWDRVCAAAAPLTEKLLERVSVAPAAPPIDRQSFFSGVGVQTAAGRGSIFDGHLFTASARTSQADSAADSWVRTVESGFGVTAVTVQLTQGLPTYDLTGLEAGQDPARVSLPDTGMDF